MIAPDALISPGETLEWVNRDQELIARVTVEVVGRHLVFCRDENGGHHTIGRSCLNKTAR